jgi:hypothetical protein
LTLLRRGYRLTAKVAQEEILMSKHRAIAGWYATVCLLVLFGMAISGCGGAKRRGPTGTVTGVVTYKGKPVPSGRVTFYGPDNEPASATLDEDGSYQAEYVPVGQATITVETPPPPAVLEKVAKQSPHGKRFGVGNPIEVPKDVVSVPTKYNSAARSGLSYTVTEGKQNHDIELK